MDLKRAAHFCTLPCVLVASIGTVSAIYAPFETRRVPVSRLVENLERQVAADPADVQSRINLARLHGMAYALKAEELPATVDKETGKDQPWFSPDARLIPYRPQPAQTAAAEAEAKEHLAKAIATYEEALKLSPDNPTALLGLGWVLDQAGEDARAIQQYRRVIAVTWPNEQKMTALPLGRGPFTREAAEYLIPLLDRARDAAEIKDLESKREYFQRLPRAITPIAIPLTGDLTANAIHDRHARVRFDADGSGLEREWTWITPDAGWLVYDAERKGEVTSALQLFGNVTFWLFWENGYQALGALDDDRNGELEDGELRHLAIWRDVDRDGVSDPGEIRELSDFGIVALSCEYEGGDDVRFAAVSPQGVRFADGRIRPTYDVILVSPASVTTFDE
jgi:tetratricopeptide (TPR) repeat protein